MAIRIEKARWPRMVAEVDEKKRAESNGLSRLEAIYQAAVGRVYTLCLRLLIDARAAEEATSAAFVRLSREMARWLDEQQVLSRLRELAIEEALARLLRRGLGNMSVQASVAASPIPATGATAGGDTPARLDQATLDRLAAQLPDRLRVAFVLRDREGLRDGIIASHLQTDEAGARRLVHQARLELRRLWLGR